MAADQMLTELTEDTALASGDLFYAVCDPGTTAVDRKVTIDTIVKAIGTIGSLTDQYIPKWEATGTKLNDSAIYQAATTNLIGVNTATPRKRVDILDASAVQLRLTHTDNTVYTDFQTNSSGYLLCTPSGARMTVGTSVAPDSTLHLHISSAGVVNSASGEFTIEKVDSVSACLLTGNTAECYIHFGDVDDADVSWMRYNHTTDRFSIRTAAAERVDLSAAGLRIEIGGVSAAAECSLDIYEGSAGSVAPVAGTKLKIEDDNDAYLSFLTPNNKTSGVYFGDADSNVVGGMLYSHSDNSITFVTAGASNLVLTTASHKFLTTAAAAAECVLLKTTDSPTSNSAIVWKNNGDATQALIGRVFGYGSSILEFRDASSCYVLITSDGTAVGTLRVGNDTETFTGSMNIKCAREVVTLAGATKDSTIDIPSGSLLLGIGACVNTTVTDSAGDDTWTVAYTGGSATALSSGAVAAAQNTKHNFLIVPEKASSTTNVRFTPNGGNFTAGVIELLAYYIDTTSLANA